MSEAISKTNELFYSDEVNEEIVFEISSSNMTPQQALNKLNEFSQAISTKLDELATDEVANVFARIVYDNDFAYEHPALVCHLSGHKPWSKEKINAFDQKMSEGAVEVDDDVEVLKALIEKHQDIAFETLIDVLKRK